MAQVKTAPPGLPESTSGATYLFADAEEELREALRVAEVVFYWGWGYSIESFRSAWSEGTGVRWIHSAGIGVDRLMFPELVNSGVVITNCRGVYDDSISEYALMLMLIFAKDFLRTLTDQREHRWNQRSAEQLSGQRVLIIGTGSIGRAIARRARAIGMDVAAIARSARPHDPELGVVRSATELPDALREADFVVLSLPLTSATKGMIDGPALDRMKPSARLINLGRGALVDEKALIDALSDHRLGGAALDVFSQEPLPPDHPLWDFPNVVISPHMAGELAGMKARFVESFLENLHRWRDGAPLLNVVDKSLGYVPTHV